MRIKFDSAWPLRLSLPLSLPLPALLLCLELAAASAGAQPQIELPPEAPPAPARDPSATPPPAATGEQAPAPGTPRKVIPRPPGLELPRESAIEVPLSGEAPASATAIGAYGEITLEGPLSPPGPLDGKARVDPDFTRVDVRRLVLFLGHNFTDRLRVYTELEVEHAIASSGDRGEFEVEQLFLDYLPLRYLNLRAGLLLMPVGIVNQYHEPPTFNGTLRPETDTRIIPSTWREVGGGLFGGAGPVRWQLYGVTSFRARDWNAEGLREGHQEGQLARAHDWGVVGRIDLQPVPGLDVGASGYYAAAGQGDPALGRAGAALAEVDVRFRYRGFEGRGELVNVWIFDADTINRAKKSDYDALSPAPSDPFAPVSRQLRGGYVELGYNLLQPLHLRLGSSLVAFLRYERTHTQAEVVGYPAIGGKERQLVTAGLNFRPVAEVAVKLDYQHLTAYDLPGSPGATSWSQINAGLSFMF